MRRRLALATVPLMVLLGTGGGIAAAQAASTPPAARPGSVDPARTATLITGDRVTLVPGGGVSIRPGPGRATIPMLTSAVGGHVRVIPADALPLLRADRLDQRLFDVTGLLAAGYDDRRGDLPLIVGDTAVPAATDAATGQVVRRLPSIGAAAVRTRKRDAGRLWSAIAHPGAVARRSAGGAGKVWLDAVGHPAGSEGVQQIGAPAAWQAGLTGAGVTVAVLDTGIDTSHPDLAGQVAAQVDFSPVSTGGVPTSEDVHDIDGHGTHVASILAGTGAASDGKYRGVAPGVRLVSGKVGDVDTTESSVIAAMEWAAGEQHAKVINMSLGFPDSAGAGPLEVALNRLTEQDGALFVVAVGNDGNNGNNPNDGDDYDILSPASADDALSVGAVDQEDRLAEFSSRGPRLGDDVIKPDLTAPGVDVTGARSADAYGDGQPYDTGDGTSYAAPHAAGSAAILAQRHPGWTPAMLKSALIATARSTPGAGVFAQGAGRVDIPSALHDSVLADPPSVSFGTQTWPHTGNTPIVKTVTYRNTGDRPVTLSLRLAMTGPGGRAAPAGLFGLSRRSVTVPAGGTAAATVTAGASANAVDGAYSGGLTATGDDQRVVTPVGLVREAEHHDLTLTHLGRDGVPTDTYDTEVIGIDTPYYYNSVYHYLEEPEKPFTLSVPKGRYAIFSSILESDGDNWNSTVLAQPDLRIDADREIALDARAGRPVQVTVPRPDAVRAASAIDVGIRTLSGWTSHEAYLNTSGQMYTARLGAAASPRDFVSGVRAAFQDAADPDAYAYQAAWYRPGDLPTGFTAAVRPDELATVAETFRRHRSDSEAWSSYRNEVPGYPLVMTGLGVALPRTQYVRAVPGLRWIPQLQDYVEGDEYGDLTTVGTPVAYQPGRTYREDWNGGVQGPCLAPPAAAPDWGVVWNPDHLMVHVPLLCDGAGHVGWTDPDYGTTTLTRDGVVVADAEKPGRVTFNVRPDGARYRLGIRTQRGGLLELAGRSTVDWTFTAPPGGTGPVRLPISVVRMQPALDTANTAPAGTAYQIPMRVQGQPGSAAPAATAVTLDVSYDDGATWRTAAVTRTGTDTFVARVTHPAAAGYVSLRATASGGGSTVEQTTIRAYRIAPR